jgi:sec-independent protein translocase protein TatA
MGIGVWKLVLLLLIVLVLFGAKKLKTIGADLGGAIKGFRKALSEEEEPRAEAAPPAWNCAGNCNWTSWNPP